MVYNSLNNKDKNDLILKKYFFTQNNWSLLDQLYRNRFKTKNSLIEFELDLLENEIQKLLLKNNLNKEENDILTNLRIYFTNKMFDHSISFHYLSNPVFNESSCLMSIFDVQQRKIIFDKQNALKKEIDNDVQKYLNGEFLSEYAQIKMFEYLSSEYSNKGEQKQRKKDIIKKIMKKNKQNNYYEVKFLYNYINQTQSAYNNYEACKLYFDYRIPGIGPDANIVSYEFPSIASNCGVFTEGIIVMNSFVHHFNYNNEISCYAKNLPSYISAVFHESWHQKQSDDCNNQKYTVENFAQITSELLFSNYDVYRTNYDFIPIEYQAQLQQNNETIEIISFFSDDKSFSEQEIRYIKNKQNKLNIVNSYAMVISDVNATDSVPKILDEYIVVEIEKKLKKNPSILNKYKLLKLFYNSNGCLKSFEELVDGYYNILIEQKDFDYNCEYNSLFFPFLTYLIKEYNLDYSIENNPFNARVQKILTNLAIKEANELFFMITGYEFYRSFEQGHLKLLNKNFENSQNIMIKERFKRFKRYISYIKDSKEIERITEPIAPYLEKIEFFESAKAL